MNIVPSHNCFYSWILGGTMIRVILCGRASYYMLERQLSEVLWNITHASVQTREASEAWCPKSWQGSRRNTD